ncbi:UNVERIFIED_CONTAM: hypothetical protein HDU68_008920 [Siphonaria sp. JEL0065]|nr:hypothetical protein HDU68_008920 [Siphonaria sp. JEL0065]
MKAFDEVKAKGGKINSFISWCGGLPTPEASNNSLGYKFSWSPRGILLAGLTSAVFKRDGRVETIPEELLMRKWRTHVAKKLKPHPADASGLLDRVMASLNWLEMLSKTHEAHPTATILDTFCALLQKKLVYKEGDRDLVVMHHVFGVEWANGTQNEMTSFHMVIHKDTAPWPRLWDCLLPWRLK